MATKIQRKNDATSYPSPICRTDCKVCNSIHRDFIHAEIERGRGYREICDDLKGKKKFSISASSISRHMSNYRENLNALANAKLADGFDEKADRLALHKKQVAILADLAYDDITRQMEAGTLKMTPSDYEKFVKLYHLVLSGDESAFDSIVKIYQKSASKYGFRLDQGVLFEPKEEQ